MPAAACCTPLVLLVHVMEIRYGDSSALRCSRNSTYFFCRFQFWPEEEEKKSALRGSQRANLSDGISDIYQNSFVVIVGSGWVRSGWLWRQMGDSCMPMDPIGYAYATYPKAFIGLCLHHSFRVLGAAVSAHDIIIYSTVRVYTLRVQYNQTQSYPCHTSTSTVSILYILVCDYYYVIST